MNTQALVGGVGLSRVVFVGVINRLYWVLYRHTLLPTRNVSALLKTHTDHSYNVSANLVTAKIATNF